VEFTVADSPSVPDVSAVPERFTSGFEYAFHVDFIDPDNEIQTTHLVYGPPGLVVAESGLVTYTPKTLLSSVESYNAVFRSSDDQVVELRLILENPNPIVARGGLSVPNRHNGIYIDDFDVDGKVEILTTDNRKKIQSLEFLNGVFQQEWIYPYAATGEIVYYTPYATDIGELLVVTQYGIFVAESRDSEPVQVYNSTSSIVGATYSDFDLDGVGDVAILLEGQQLEIVDTENWNVRASAETSRRNRSVNEITHANVDEDPAIEIIVGSGDVIDGSDGSVQWSHARAFGGGITIGDIDNDGIDEFIAADRYHNLAVYDVSNQTEIEFQSEDRLNDICSPILLNIDSDLFPELVTGGCQAEDVHFWEIQNQTLVRKEGMSLSVFGDSQYLSAGDIDNDGNSEILWSSGTNTSRRDMLHYGSTHHTNENIPAEFAALDYIPTLFGISVAGVTSSDTSDRSVVFTVDNAESNETFIGSQIAGSLAADGTLLFGGFIGFDTFNISPGFLYDANHDGSSDLVHIDDSGHVRFTDVSTFETFDTYENFNSGAPFSLDHAQLLALSDGTDAILLSDDRNSLELIGIDNKNLIADFKVDFLSSTTALSLGDTDYLAAAGSELIVWKRFQSGFAKIGSTNLQCDEIEAISIENQFHVVCVRIASGRSISIYNEKLEQVNRKSISYSVTAMEIIRDNKSDKILLGTSDGFVIMIDGVTGQDIWRSPPLNGAVKAIKYVVEDQAIVVSTNYAVYVSSEL